MTMIPATLLHDILSYCAGRSDQLIIVATLQVFTLRLGATHRSQSLRLTWSLEPA